ncbi:MAG TPA: RDD family protein [Solirubrobacteraceae bacterium]|nr:RDD family protein [Solirubrobacteraceae bacterium]
MTEHAGLATRSLAFAVDAAIINAVAWAVAAVVALGLSLLKVPDGIVTAMAVIGTAIVLGWSIAYFAYFWSATGQTPGNRLLSIRVVDARSLEPPHAGRAVLRVLALPLSALPLCAGFLMILVDARRRALHDVLVGTFVIYVAEPEPVATHVPAGSAKALH